MPPLISLSTDFGPGNKGIGVMKATILGICPGAEVIDLAHNIGGFNIKEGARLLEATAWLPVGFHVCVVDPGVGTARKAIAIETKRGDVLIGPNNGVLIPATHFLGGIVRAHELSNERYMRTPVSAIFHGRDIFAPAAAHLASGVKLEAFGPAVAKRECGRPPFENATLAGGVIHAEVIDINQFGSLFLNILQQDMHALSSTGDTISLRFDRASIAVTYHHTFGDVPVGKEVMMDDDFGRVEVAVNMGSFAQTHGIAIGDRVELHKS